MRLPIPEMFVGSGPQLLAVLSGTINVVSDGMQYGWTAPSIPLLRSQDSPVKITHSNEIWLEILYLIGGLVGLPISIAFIDVIGRKMTVWISSIIGICGWICIGAGNNVYYLYAGRFLLGITADIAFTASPVYISEIAHQKIRGFLAGLIYLMMLVGIIVIYSIGPWIPIYASAIVGSSLLLVQLIIFPFMPESPYFLIYVNKDKEAEKALKRLRQDKNVSEELNEIKKAVERQKTETGRPQDLFLIKSNRKAATIMMLLNITQHISGVSILIMNLHTILHDAGSDLISPDISAVMFPVLMFISATTATFLVDRCGRKILLTSSGIITTITLLVLAVYFHLKLLGFPTHLYNWVPLAAVMVYAAGVKFGLGIVPIVITAELFPAKVKGMGMAFSDMMYLLSSIISLYLYPWMNQALGIHISFYVFSFFCILCTVMISFYVPETKGKTLEEIQMILKDVGEGKKIQDTRM
ncbi:facilitated trehalose transporter Tret1-like [Harmonia axyridis]|uniref:facilitated trehalose transporter Tret1-like n=1 Tax=Harmonia axyridis TaxID=115357 RepID=UPI001E275E70|nr:facilitated trehalose transporter Tret1-like [Harmonia axyridis]XP_045480475.1 facilitated trehalose transporter Tret1-like [Harmonia axyridis]XP_045480476.1 facilitated trehalose transporter Tret1-like [Harmonia axyridis]